MNLHGQWLDKYVNEEYEEKVELVKYERSIDILKAIIEKNTLYPVRCKDCKHYKQSNVADRKMCFRKDIEGVPVCYDFLPDDWCKYGER